MEVCFIGGGNRRKPLTLSHNVVSSTSRHEQDSNLGGCKTNYNTITTMMAPMNI